MKIIRIFGIDQLLAKYFVILHCGDVLQKYWKYV